MVASILDKIGQGMKRIAFLKKIVVLVAKNHDLVFTTFFLPLLTLKCLFLEHQYFSITPWELNHKCSNSVPSGTTAKSPEDCADLCFTKYPSSNIRYCIFHSSELKCECLESSSSCEKVYEIGQNIYELTSVFPSLTDFTLVQIFGCLFVRNSHSKSDKMGICFYSELQIPSL